MSAWDLETIFNCAGKDLFEKETRRPTERELEEATKAKSFEKQEYFLALNYLKKLRPGPSLIHRLYLWETLEGTPFLTFLTFRKSAVESPGVRD